MAQRISPEERELVVKFVRDAYEASGQRSWAAFARKAGVSEYSLQAWRTGKTAPEAINLLRLMAAADLLRETEDGYEIATPTSDAPNGAPPEEEARQADAVALLEEIRALMRHLEAFAGPDAARWRTGTRDALPPPRELQARRTQRR